MIAANEDGQRLDGIEKVYDDGSVKFRDENMDIMNEILGYNRRTLKIEV